jgi:Undecaprenyl-phosphate galactose phosphotransferase WbaP
MAARLALQWLNLAGPFTQLDLRLAGGFTAAMVIVNWYQGLYATVLKKPAVELRQMWFASLAFGLLFVALQTVLLDLPKVQSALLVWLAVTSVVVAMTMPVMRALARIAFGRKNWWGRRVLLVGCGERSGDIFRRLRRSPELGLRPIGFLEDFDQLSDDADADGYLGPIAELNDCVAENNVSLGVLAATSAGRDSDTKRLLARPQSGISDWLVMTDCEGLPCLWSAPGEIVGMPAVEFRNRLNSSWRRGIKRAFDVFCVLMIAPIVAPVVGLVALWVRFRSPGASPFYASERIGRDGRRFRMWKLRTMIPNGHEVLREYLEKHPELREEYERDCKLKNDPRILPGGSFIRKTSLDELPQVWNIFTGEMSIVGPRPMLVEEREKYGDTFEEYCLVTPGITGMWQVNGRNNTAYGERLIYTDYYVKNWSLWLDLYLLYCTVKVVLLREGAY